MDISQNDVIAHFTSRAPGYNSSSAWCTDDKLVQLILELAKPESGHTVLDVACGTGLVSRLLHGRVRRLVGIDISPAMSEQAEPYLDEMVAAPAEKMPFASDTFDLVVCRQGIQFMNLPDAVREMVRVTRPGGQVILVNLCAYGPGDAPEYFEILRLRNPVRRHFFLPDDIPGLLREAGCGPVEVRRFISVEDVDVWSDNGAIDEPRRQAIREAYRDASPMFRQLHAVRQADGRYSDHMLFVTAGGRKP